MDPPDEEVATGPGNEPDRDDRGCDRDDPDRDGPDEEPLAYRPKRLRLWRTPATLAVAVAHLIRSL